MFRIIFFAFLAIQTTFGAQMIEPRKKIIVWDLGYVLTKDNKLKMTSYILPRTCGFNPWNLVRLVSLAKKGCFSAQVIQKTMDDVLHHARQHEQRQEVIVNQHGQPHENIDCDHHRGTKSDAELFAEIKESIRRLDLADKLKNNPDELFFKNPAHKYLVEKTFQLRFIEPQFYGESFTPIAEGVALLEKCAKAGHEMAILSNWSAESFPYLKFSQKTEAIFKHFKPEHIFVSGNMKVAKPYPQAYAYVIEKMQASPEDFIFIDDQIKNIEAARAVGMHAIHLADYKKAESYQTVEAELQRLGAL